MTLHEVLFFWHTECEFLQAVLVDLARDAVHQLAESLLRRATQQIEVNLSDLE